MREYSLTTAKSWAATNHDLAFEFEKWGVTQWDTNYHRGARLEGFNQSVEDRAVTLTYVKNGKTIVLKMDKQARAVDNLRVLYIAINTIRMNERRGVGEVMESAYLQLNSGGSYKRDPYEVLGVLSGSPVEVCEAMYKVKVKQYHPDLGGSEAQMTELNEAIKVIREKK